MTTREKQQTFRVTVKVEVVNGDANQVAQVNVDIIVTDINEPPTVVDEEGGAAKTEVDDYPEIDDGAPNTAPVATYVGTDPEGARIIWDVRGADASRFTIDGGVLKFRSPPDFENMKDKAGEFTATPDATVTDGTYNVVIRASASRFRGDTGPTHTVEIPVAVTVINVDEPGEVDISWLQPEVDTAITASVTDPDNEQPGTPTWQWAVSKVALNLVDIDIPGHWGTAPGSPNTEDSYTPVASDVGKFLRVTATYTVGGEDSEERARSVKVVQAEGGGAENGSPDFEHEKAERTVGEDVAVGSKVGAPVLASVKSVSLKDTLTYSLRAFTAGDVGNTGLTFDDIFTGGEGAPTAADDLAAFDIDKATGQITTAAKAGL